MHACPFIIGTCLVVLQAEFRPFSILDLGSFFTLHVSVYNRGRNWDPFVRPTRSGNVALVALPIEHGADTFIAYHDLGGRFPRCPFGEYMYERGDVTIPVNFSCGRVVQLAMEMGLSTMVQFLVDAGADIQLSPRPLWPIPVWPVPRAVHVKVTAGLEEVLLEGRTKGQNLALSQFDVAQYVPLDCESNSHICLIIT
jgi:hypothetical protein